MYIFFQEINKALDQAIQESDSALTWLDKDCRPQQAAEIKLHVHEIDAAEVHGLKDKEDTGKAGRERGEQRKM